MKNQRRSGLCFCSPALSFLVFLNHTRMLLCLSVIVDSDKQQISMILLQAAAVFFPPDLMDGAMRTFIPFQLYYQRRFFRKAPPWKIHKICKSFPTR